MRESPSHRSKSFLRQLITLLVVAITLSFPLLSQAHHTINITYVRPGQWAFWKAYGEFLEEVAKDLGVQVTTIEFRPNKMFDALKQIQTNVESNNPPDYFITGYFAHIGYKTVDTLNKANIPYFLINTDIHESEKALVGKPREKHPLWLGHMFPDDHKAGYDLADNLLAKVNDDNKQMIALRGWYKSSASTERENGLKKRLSIDKHSKLLRLVGTSKGENQAKDSTEKLFGFYPELSLIWASADNLALGAITAAKKVGLQPGVNIHIGGIDWTNEAIKAIKNGDMTVSIGGHFMEGGWALLMLYDYAHGIDFKEEQGVTIRSKMQAITKENVEEYSKYFSSEQWKDIDFREFSKVHNKKLKEYDFSLEHLLSNAKTNIK